jgi:hypothetical protein
MGRRYIREKAKPLELWWWTQIEPIIPDTADVWVGQAEKGNSLPCPGTLCTFQFGDIRIETPSRTITIEVDTVGSPLVNLLKFWPWLEGMAGQLPVKPFTLMHIWGISFPTQKELWKLMVSEFLGPRSHLFKVPAEFLPYPNAEDDLQAVLSAVQRRLQC